MASALVQLASDLRAMNGHLDLASTAILTAVELGHTEGRPVSELKLAQTTGLSRQTVGRRLDHLVEMGEILRVRFHHRGRPYPDIVYVLDPLTANEPRRVRRVKEAIADHADQVAQAMKAMNEDEGDEDLPILPANGDILDPRKVS
jgi:DNA-binding Lrp family transcriptional regulator